MSYFKSVKVTPELHTRLAEAARKERRSACAHLMHILDTHLPPLQVEPHAAAEHAATSNLRGPTMLLRR